MMHSSCSSMGSVSQPTGIASSRSHSSYYSTCAFPAWPQRQSLDDKSGSGSYSGFAGRASCYVSDDDLTSSPLSSGAAIPVGAPQILFPYAPQPTDAELLELERERAAMQREVTRFLVAEKERRHQQALALHSRRRRGLSSSKDNNNDEGQEQ